MNTIVSRLVGEGDRQRFWQKVKTSNVVITADMQATCYYDTSTLLLNCVTQRHLHADPRALEPQYQKELEAGEEEEEEEEKEDVAQDSDEVEVDATPGGTVVLDDSLGDPIVNDTSPASLTGSKKKKNRRRKSRRRSMKPDSPTQTGSSAKEGEASLGDVQVEMDEALGYPIVVDDALGYPIVNDTSSAEESEASTKKNKKVTRKNSKRKKQLVKTGSFSRSLLQSR